MPRAAESKSSLGLSCTTKQMHIHDFIRILHYFCLDFCSGRYHLANCVGEVSYSAGVRFELGVGSRVGVSGWVGSMLTS